MILSEKAKRNLMWLEECQKEYSILLSQFIDVIKPLLYQFTDSSLEVSVGIKSDGGFSSLLAAKTSNILIKLEVVNNDVKLYFCDVNNNVSTMFVVNLSYIKDFNMEKILFTSQGFIVYNIYFTYMNVKYYLKLKTKINL